MDAAKKKKLIDSLSLATKFDENLSEDGRLWFLDRAIRTYEAAGKTDTQITTDTPLLVTAAKARVAADRDFDGGLKALGNARFGADALKMTRRHRVEILYGAIAHEPEFAKATQREYLLFIAKRRFRVFARIYFWVNPNSQGYFRYPHKCPLDQRWRVNEDAALTFWVPEVAGSDLPIKFKPAGDADPDAAIAALYVTKPACTGNLFDCAVVTDITFIDSLRAAKTPATFLAAMPAEYLKIKHMDSSEFAQKPADTKNPLQKVRVPMPPRDLQVGDHCYIYNHPLYKAFRPTGSWTGEFSFVFISGNRDHRSQKGFVFGGHGMNGTLYQFYNAFVKELATYLTLARNLARAHLTYMAGGAAAIAPSTAVELEDDVIVVNHVTGSPLPAARHRLIEYDASILARDFTKVPTRSTPKPRTRSPGFLAVHSKSKHTFYFVKIDSPDEDKSLMTNLKKKIADLPTPRTAKFPIKIQRLTAPAAGATLAEIYAIEHWGVAYVDRATSTEKFWAFFETKGGVLKRKELTTDKGEPSPDLFDAPFHPFTSASSDIEVYLPRVEFGPHRAFLAGTGAF
jgi:hypothetical protein